MAKCPEIKPMEWDEFTGCDGKPLPDEFLGYQLGIAVNKENYEWATRIRDELKRRKNILKSTPERAEWPFLDIGKIEHEKILKWLDENQNHKNHAAVSNAYTVIKEAQSLTSKLLEKRDEDYTTEDISTTLGIIISILESLHSINMLVVNHNPE